MVIFHCYVSSPEGNYSGAVSVQPSGTPFQDSALGFIYGWSNLTFCVCGKHEHLEMCVVTCRGASDPGLRR